MKELLEVSHEELVLLGGFLVIAISANQIAKKFQQIKLPLITGLVVAGILAGPYVFGLIPEVSKHKLNYINEIALAFIAFAAGSELYLRELRSRVNSIKWNTFGQLFITFFLGSILVAICANWIPFMHGLNFGERLSVSILMGTVFVARSPASAIAVINEVRAKGPFTQTVMGVTVVKDFLVIMLFAINLSFAEVLIDGEKFDLLTIVFILGEITVSVGLGFILGGIINIFLSFKMDTTLKLILVLGAGFSSYLLSHYIKDISTIHLGHKVVLEPLLTCIIASFYVTNYSKFRNEFLKLIEESGSTIYVAFFTLTGASMSIDILLDVWPVALLLFTIRLFTIILGAYTGGFLARDPMKYNHVGWMPYLTQAGVALGLATLIANEFPSWGDQFATSVIAMIVINQFIGPPLFKYALDKVGENRTKGSSDFDGIRDVIIFGYESQALALARQLQKRKWQVKIATLLKEETFKSPDDVEVIHITGLSKKEFDKLSAEKTEVVVGMLSDRENLEICEICYQAYGIEDMIVRLNEHYNSKHFVKLGAKLIYPSMAIVSLLEHFVRSPQATSLLLGMEEGQDTRDIEILNRDIHGIALRDLRLPTDVIILSIRRGGQMIISHGYTRLRTYDIVTFVGSNESLDELMLKFEG